MEEHWIHFPWWIHFLRCAIFFSESKWTWKRTLRRCSLSIWTSPRPPVILLLFVGVYEYVYYHKHLLSQPDPSLLYYFSRNHPWYAEWARKYDRNKFSVNPARHESPSSPQVVSDGWEEVSEIVCIGGIAARWVYL